MLVGALSPVTCVSGLSKKLNMVLNVHKNHKAYFLGWGQGLGRRGYGGGGQVNCIPIATLSPLE